MCNYSRAVNERFSENSLLPPQFEGQRTEYRTAAILSGVPEQAVRTMPLVVPSGMIRHRIKADAMQRHAAVHGRGGFAAHITKPARALVAFAPGFGDQHGAAIPLVILAQDVAERPVAWLAQPDGRAVVAPLVVVVVVQSNDVEVLGMTAELRAQAPREHIQALELEQAVVF